MEIVKGDIFERKQNYAGTIRISQRRIRTMGPKQITMDFRDNTWGPISEDWADFHSYGWNVSPDAAQIALAGWTLVYRNGQEVNADGSPFGEPEAKKWYVGIGLPGCLYDSTYGPYDSEEEAFHAGGEAHWEATEFGNPKVIAEVFQALPSEMGEDF